MRVSSFLWYTYWSTLLWSSLLHGAALSFAFAPRLLLSPPSSSWIRHASLQQEQEQTIPQQPQQSKHHTVILAENEEFVKPLPDKRLYRAILLSNGLRALLVSSPQSDVEAGALHVQAGHFDDTRPGLAHFQEHMLFLGTHKYPSPEEFETYLSTNGGSSNAYTDMEDTNYYFSVTPNDDDDGSNNVASSALLGALDRFSQFFVSPLLEPTMVERELRAIDSEYRNALTSDAWRNYQLLKSACHKQHPFHKFGCGTYDTLNSKEGGLHDDLWEFYNTHYQTYNMRLCVVGRASLDALQQAVESTFGNLAYSDPTRNRRGKMLNPPVTEFPTEHSQYSSSDGDIVKAFDSHNLGKIRETIPIMESHSLKIAFATPPLDDALLKESRPYRVLSHLLGHESPGSLHALLNNKGWLVGLTSGIGIDCSDFSLFTLTLSLTPDGMKHVDEILNLTFQWIALLKETKDETLQSYHDELRQIASMNFQFRENGDSTDFCSSAAELLFSYKPSQLLVGPAMTGDFDPIMSKAFLNRMRPDNALITIINSDWKANEEWKTEPWYKAQYRDIPMTLEQIDRWSNPSKIDPELHLPALNDYIPTDFTLKCDQVVAAETQDDDDISLELQPPTRLIDDHQNLILWHKMDRYWKVPKTYIRVSLLTPNVYRSPRTMTLNRIYQRVLNDDLNSFVYDAGVAGCSYRVACIPTGYRISVKGYSEKLPFLLKTLTSRMLSLLQQMKDGDNAALQRKFDKAKANLLRETKNYRLDTPYEVASYNARLLMEESVWYVDNYIDEMEQDPPLTMQECAEVAQECLLGRVKAEALCIGNIDEEGAKEVANVLDNVFLKNSRPLLDVETPVFRSMKFPTREEAKAIFGTLVDDTRSTPLVYQEVAYSPSEENNAVELVLQTACDMELGYKGVAILELIAHMAYNSAFNQLRTVEQLGYIVSSFARKSAGGSWALSTVVQSSVAEPTKLEERMEAWLVQFRNELGKMDADDIAAEASAVVAQLLERDTRLSQEVGRAWSEIMATESLSDSLKNPPFDRLERISEELMVANDDTDESDSDSDDSMNASSRRQSAEELKTNVLEFFDTYLARESPSRRAMSSRVYSQKFKEAYEEGVGKPGILCDYGDIFDLKQYLSTWPTVPYWAKRSKGSDDAGR